MDRGVGWRGRVWINEGRLVTDGATSVDGCFNFSLPLYILSMLFIRQKYKNSFAPPLKPLLLFLLSNKRMSLFPCVACWPPELKSDFKRPFICRTSWIFWLFLLSFKHKSYSFFIVVSLRCLLLQLTSPVTQGHKLWPPFPPGSLSLPSLSFVIPSNLPSETIIISICRSPACTLYSEVGVGVLKEEKPWGAEEAEKMPDERREGERGNERRCEERGEGHKEHINYLWAYSYG